MIQNVTSTRMRILSIIFIAMATSLLLQCKIFSQTQDEKLFASKYCGIWKYSDVIPEHYRYLKIIRNEKDKFILNEGWEDDGKITWVEDDIVLKLTKGKLQGEFLSYNFRATHGMEFNYNLTLELTSNDKLQYTVDSDGSMTEEAEAIKISDYSLDDEKETGYIRDVIIQSLINLSSLAISYYKKPKSMDGGGNSFIGWQIPSVLEQTSEAMFKIEKIRTQNLEILGLGFKLGDDIKNKIMYKVIVNSKGKIEIQKRN